MVGYIGSKQNGPNLTEGLKFPQGGLGSYRLAINNKNETRNVKNQTKKDINRLGKLNRYADGLFYFHFIQHLSRKRTDAKEQL